MKHIDDTQVKLKKKTTLYICKPGNQFKYILVFRHFNHIKHNFPAAKMCPVKSHVWTGKRWYVICFCKQFVNIVVNIFGELKNVLIKIPADIIKYKMGRKLQKGPIIIIKRDYTQTL